MQDLKILYVSLNDHQIRLLFPVFETSCHR